MKSLYAGPVFEMARNQFHVIADHLSIPEDDRDRLLYPKRAIVVSCPITWTTAGRKSSLATACSTV